MSYKHSELGLVEANFLLKDVMNDSYVPQK